MPWEISKSDRCPASKPHAVVKKGSDAPVACHESREAAVEHMRALYANEKSMSAEDWSEAMAWVVSAVEG